MASGRRNGAGWCGLVMMIATHTSRGPWHNVILTPVCSVSLLHVTRRHYPRAAPHEMSTYLLIAEGSPVATAVAFPSSDIHHACHMTKDWRPQKQILCNGALPCLSAVCRLVSTKFSGDASLQLYADVHFTRHAKVSWKHR